MQLSMRPCRLIHPAEFKSHALTVVVERLLVLWMVFNRVGLHYVLRQLAKIDHLGTKLRLTTSQQVENAKIWQAGGSYRLGECGK